MAKLCDNCGLNSAEGSVAVWGDLENLILYINCPQCNYHIEVGKI